MTEPLSDQSSYVSAIQAILGADSPVMAKWLVDYSHYSFFCDLFAGNFCPQIVTYLYKCKKLSDAGAQSLLLDMTTIRSTLLQIPVISALQSTDPFVDPVPEKQPKKAR